MIMLTFVAKRRLFPQFDLIKDAGDGVWCIDAVWLGMQFTVMSRVAAEIWTRRIISSGAMKERE